MAHISLKKFKEALEDCNLALNLNPNFAKAYKRMFRVYLSLGELEVSNPSRTRINEFNYIYLRGSIG